jgi:acyl dehydratase
VIAHGMWVASHLAEYAQRVRREGFGPDYRLVRFQVRFKGMTLLGERLQLRGSHRESEPGKILLQLEALGEQGEVKATASASLWKK